MVSFKDKKKKNHHQVDYMFYLIEYLLILIEKYNLVKISGKNHFLHTQEENRYSLKRNCFIF